MKVGDTLITQYHTKWTITKIRNDGWIYIKKQESDTETSIWSIGLSNLLNDGNWKIVPKAVKINRRHLKGL